MMEILYLEIVLTIIYDKINLIMKLIISVWFKTSDHEQRLLALLFY